MRPGLGGGAEMGGGGRGGQLWGQIGEREEKGAEKRDPRLGERKNRCGGGRGGEWGLRGQGPWMGVGEGICRKVGS